MTSNKPYPPTMPLDMGQFNSITEGKNTFQDELLGLFFQNSAECVLVMERSFMSGSGEKWQESLEELKNLSASIGALELSKICAIAGKMGDASPEDKKRMLTTVRTHIQRLRAFIRNTR